LSQPTTLKAEESYGYDYWFTPEAIYRVTIISYPFVFVLFIGAILLSSVVNQFLPLPFPPGLISLVAAFVLAYLVLKRMARSKRIAMGSPPSKEVLENQKNAKKIPWEEIKVISLTRKRNIRILVGIHAYRGSIKPQDYESLKAFLTSKIGVRLQIREGTF